MIDWSTLPDLAAVALLTCAFGSVARQGHTPVSRLWLTGWIMIALHFAAHMFGGAPGAWGTIASVIGLDALAWAGILFMWACVPHRNRTSSRGILLAVLGANTLYISLLVVGTHSGWVLDAAASLFLLPLALALLSLRQFTHPLRWSLVTLYMALAVFLLAVQQRTPNGQDWAFDAVIFTVYFGCCIHFWFAYRRSSAGSFVTLAGFAAWAAVFVVAPLMQAYLPQVHVDSEVWNLPKYVVTVGMILLLLEDQIEHNRYLALHDELTGLPNRRLFQDRMANALERARRNRTRAALLLIDLDHFKRVNDTVGHHIGDLLLRRVGTLFLARVRRSDTVARTGGDEFAVILEEPITREDAERVGDALVQRLKEPIELEHHTLTVGASVGIAMFPEDADTVERLRIAADRNMYAEKKTSRGAESGQAVPGFPEGLPEE
ncbi:MAG: GGDEF domain-containing protein [Acidobacteriaceae bacterium]